MSTDKSRHKETPRSLTTSQRRMLTKRELAEFFAVSTKTIERQVAAGMPSLVVGGQRRFDLSKATAWLEARGA
jgi:phage terminase Nu1 subunit (DNA packaging protein)